LPIFPYEIAGNHLKGSSYEARAEKFIWWDKDGRQQSEVKEGKPFTLRANSITFAQIQPRFQLPSYIALRFNLRIKHVHRGLLLGTGPLVDPGFSGRLLVPLHNLTSQDYKIESDESLIWIEFTKTSRNTRAGGHIGEIEDRKKDVSPETYLERANNNNPIRSSIPIAVEDAQNRADQAAISARSAEESATEAARNVRWFAGLGAVAAIVAGVTIALALHSYFGQMNSLVMSSNALVSTVTKDVSTAANDIKKAAEQNENLQKNLETANHKIAELEEEQHGPDTHRRGANRRA
jgi:hypothetical protein